MTCAKQPREDVAVSPEPAQRGEVEKVLKIAVCSLVVFSLGGGHDAMDCSSQWSSRKGHDLVQNG